ncbi:hypothetical protein SLEP1_g51429 [Rubroshorea leprosula]|uniref:Reverse transcriptase Ty1/copia-type domain-containing protein n=1 Tax=Rubroshorea leprosula TaxID=152421 RepID=A0AAV5M5S0_9ROSI|nr:hypothetical protein SLEP1_g51429 [Rubroshorea leprosula]
MVAKEVIDQPNVNLESLKQDPRTGKLLETGCKVGRLFELNYLHILDNKMDTPSFPNDRFIQTLLCVVELKSFQIPYQQIFQAYVEASSYDIALFICKTTQDMVLLLLYVDDMIITRDDVASVEELKQSLSQKFEMKDLGGLSYFLGLEVISSDDGYLLSQVKYASDLVSKTELNDSKSVSTPLEPNVKLTFMDGSPLFDPTRYWQLVGSLVYLTTTHPDIAYAVHMVSQFMAAPCSTHYVAVLLIIRYVKGILFHGLHFSANFSPVLRAYFDADWAGDPSDHKSTTGYCLFLCNPLIS